MQSLQISNEWVHLMSIIIDMISYSHVVVVLLLAESELVSVALTTPTSSASIERRKTRTVTMLLPPGVDFTSGDRPSVAGGGRARGESV